METKNREKLLMIAAASCAGLFLLNLLVLSPLMNGWRSRSDEIARLKKQIAGGAMLVRRESAIRDRWDAMRANALPANPTEAERQLFTAFDHWVSSGGVTQGSFRPQVQEGDTNFSTVDCRSDVSGSLENIRDFLKAMSHDPLANKLESFELTSKDDNGQELTLGLSLSGLVLADSGPAPGTAAPVRATNLAVNLEPDLFQMISRNNIFDQSRSPRDSGSRAPKVETITLCGTGMDYGAKIASAFFVGTGISDSRDYKVGDSINSFKIAQITTNVVTLTNSSTNIFSLTEGSPSLRREDNGPWRLSSEIAAYPAPDTHSTNSASSAPASSAGGGSIEEFLKKRRLAEEEK
jgi:hypothetical protein